MNRRLKNCHNDADAAVGFNMKERSPMRILIVEDEKRLANFVKKGLEEEYHQVDIALNGTSGLDLFKTAPYELVILDLLLPGLDGFSLCQTIRSLNAQVPILMLTARSAVEDKVKGLDSGADDYLTKPFSFSELSARVRALLRRRTPQQLQQVKVGDVVLDSLRHTVTVSEDLVDLTPREFALLEYLMRNQGYVVTRTMIAEHVWNLNFDTMTNMVDVYINHLRKKIESKSGKQIIHTIRGIGYSLRE
jgi:two-component system copper resistance phosphate regulon response regulator CusR